MLLVDGADTTPQLSQASTRKALHVHTFEPEATRGWVQCGVQQAKQGRFACTAWPNHRHTFPRLYFQGDIVDGYSAVREHFADMFQSVHEKHHLLD